MRPFTLYHGILMAFSFPFVLNPVASGHTASPSPLLNYEVGQIATPKGFERQAYPSNSFPAWLRKLPLRNNSRVYLFNGKEKSNQSAQFAVIDLPIGNKNLQQCADVCMRLRADYLRASGRENEIVFYDNASTAYRYKEYKLKHTYTGYLEKVFSWCGTLSLEKQLKKVNSLNEIEPGDVIIQGGSPGHAVLIIDVAMNKKGEKMFMLAQGFMPAQDIHVLKNTNDSDNSPWFAFSNKDYLETPEWVFNPPCVKTWE